MPPGEGAPARWTSLRAFHRLDRLRAGARCRSPRGQADAQVGELLEQGQALAGGQPRTWPPRLRSALRKWRCQPGTLTEVIAAGKRKPIRVPSTSSKVCTTCCALITSAKGR